MKRTVTSNRVRTSIPESPTPENDSLLESLPEEMRDPSSGLGSDAAESAEQQAHRNSESEGGFNVRKLVEGGVDQADTELEERARRLKRDS